MFRAFLLLFRFRSNQLITFAMNVDDFDGIIAFVAAASAY